MTWSEVGDFLHRWAAVTPIGIGLFRFAFEVVIWPNLLLLLGGVLVAVTIRRRFILWWVVGTALLMAGIWGFYATAGDSNWSDTVRPEPFGHVLLGLYVLSGIASLVAFKKRQS